MLSYETPIFIQEIIEVLEKGELIETFEEEHYPKTSLVKGNSFIGREIHLFCGFQKDHITIITIHVPEL
jgi:hypothetical protein